ncbi:MAG: amidase family protein [Candidatus Thermoplasmatota archaeon]
MAFRPVIFAVAALAVLGTGCLSSEGGTDKDGQGGVATADCLAGVAGLDLNQASLRQLQDALTAGNVTSVQLVQAYAARVAAFDAVGGQGPQLNSVREVSATALAQAAALDAERAAGSVRGPLHGIPILLKDNIGTFDEPTTAGSIALAANVPPVDATMTASLREAGMVILGKTNLSEFANWVDLSMPNGYSSLGGQVVNAYTGGDPSGSSSGSGVAGSMAFAAITIGTETSGSILGPSDANSLVGVKPTVGLVSRAGIIPLAANFDTPGPMGRHVEDVALVLGAVAGPDPLDPATAASASHLPAGNDYVARLSPHGLQGVRLGYDPNDDGELFTRALDDLRAAGADLVAIDRDQLDSVSVTELAFIFNEFKFGINDYLANQAGPGLPVTDLTGIILYNRDHPDQVKYGQNLLIASDAQSGDFVTAQFAATPTILSARAIADRFFANVDAIVGPSLSYVSIGAAAGYPTVIVPAGYDEHDPQGISFFGPAWSEADLLVYAYAYEQHSLRRESPTTITPTLLDGVCGSSTSKTSTSAPAARFD